MCKDFEFRINHKPKKIKEICYGTHVFSNAQVNSKSMTVTLDHTKYYGLSQFQKATSTQVCPIHSLIQIQRQMKESETAGAFERLRCLIEGNEE